MEKLIIIPTYNERDNIDPLLERLLALPFGLDVLVVDDGSPDGTADRVKAWIAKSPRVHLLQRPGKMGLAAPLRDPGWVGQGDERRSCARRHDRRGWPARLRTHGGGYCTKRAHWLGSDAPAGGFVDGITGLTSYGW